MTTEDDFQKRLDEQIDDHHTRLVFADWLQDRGDPRAEGYRALGVLRRIPYAWGRFLVDGEERVGGWSYHDGRGTSVNHGRTDGPVPECHALPSDWLLTAGSCCSIWLHATYERPDLSTRRGAENFAATIFMRLPEERRRELLAGAVS